MFICLFVYAFNKGCGDIFSRKRFKRVLLIETLCVTLEAYIAGKRVEDAYRRAALRTFRHFLR